MSQANLSLKILYEDNHLLVVDKPAGIATMGAESGQTVHSLAASYLKHAYNKPGRVFVGIVSRLDAMTSGVLVLARTSKAASRLSAQFASRDDAAVIKLYLAAVEGRLGSVRGELTDQVVKDDAAHRMRVVGSSHAGAQLARLRYLTLGHDDHRSLVAVRLLSGRKHQIRLQFAEHGHPVIGDRKYGSRQSFAQGIALHSWRLRIEHPTQRQPMWFDADPPAAWRTLSRLLPADDKILDRLDDSFLS